MHLKEIYSTVGSDQSEPSISRTIYGYSYTA